MIGPDALEHIAAKEVGRGEIAVCNVSTAHPVAFERHIDDREAGAFVRVDLSSGAIAAGIDSPYEPPERPEIRIDTMRASAEEAAELIVRCIGPD